MRYTGPVVNRGGSSTTLSTESKGYHTPPDGLRVTTPSVLETLPPTPIPRGDPFVDSHPDSITFLVSLDQT